MTYTTKKPLWIYAVLSAVTAVILNIAIIYSGLINCSPAYSKIADSNQNMTTLTVISSCILIPFMEEVIFRCLLYNCLRRYLTPIYSMALTSVLFGIYHLNLVQFIYAFLMGCLFAYFYEKDHRLMVPVIMHVTANTVITVLRLF